MKKYFITGINGFIGSNIARKLLEQGNEVRGIVRKTSDQKFLKGLDVKLSYGDITDKDSMIEPMKDVDVVIHVAALASDWGAYDLFYQANVVGTQNVADVAEMQGVKRFVLISSTVLHGFTNKRFIKEEDPLPKTIFPYCETKKLAEQWLFEYAKNSKMEITAIRAGNVFGVNDHTFAEKYLEALEQGKAGYIDGGKHWTCPVFSENLVDAILLATEKPEAVGEAIIITDGYEIDWKTFTDKMADALGVKRPKLSTPYWLGYSIAALMEGTYKLIGSKNPPLLTRYRISNGGTDYHFSIDKARRLLGYEPKVNLDEAIIRTVEWYRNSRQLKK
jgi:2-alkyl-3-oxoalkanoate reductase